MRPLGSFTLQLRISLDTQFCCRIEGSRTAYPIKAGAYGAIPRASGWGQDLQRNTFHSHCKG